MMPDRSLSRCVQPVILLAAALVLAGCTSLSRDGGTGAVSDLTRARAGHALAAGAADNEAVVDALLRQPLTADSAVRIALLNNRGLQASLAELGIAEADLVQAGRMRNPSFTFGRLRGAHATEIERSVMFDLVGLLTIPLRGRIESARFEQATLLAATDAVRLAADTRRAYFDAIAARQAAQYMEQVAGAAEAGAELAQRMAKVGNWSRLDQAREQAFYADAMAQVARSRHQAVAARERLTRLLGLWGDRTGYALPDRLPELPKTPRQAADFEAQAMQQRLDVQMAKRHAEATAGALGLTRATGFVNVLHAGYANRSESGEPRANGYEIELELPVFDWSGARAARAEATYMQAVHRTADAAIRARSEVREAYSAYRTAYDVAAHYRDEIVPLRKRISDEMLLRYNGMLIGVFELLADARAQIGSVNAAIEAQRDFWLAETDLQAAINGSGGAVTQLRAGAPASDAGGGH